jgi:hypothetical protein
LIGYGANRPLPDINIALENIPIERDDADEYANLKQSKNITKSSAMEILLVEKNGLKCLLVD